MTALAWLCGAVLAGPAAGRAAEETVLYAFHGADGAGPSSLIEIGGTLYGVAGGGGRNAGVVFALDLATGAERVVYTLQPDRDGEIFASNLARIGGRLYATTYTGGKFDGGTLFAFDLKNGAGKVQHTFGGMADGANPTSSLVDFGGKLYGTTLSGGDGFGTVFAFDPVTSIETVVHSFGGTDGYGPHGLIRIGDRLYGATAGAGSTGGTVFSLDPEAGTTTLVYAFLPASCQEPCGHYGDGSDPTGVIGIGGLLYGTTQDGGSSPNCIFGGCGTVFSIDPSSGAETRLHSFHGDNRAMAPGPLLQLGGRLYGTASGGVAGDGAIFWYDLARHTERIAYSFRGGSDGAYPATLIDVHGTLYGTTYSGGGTVTCGGPTPGCGTVFALKP